MQVTPALRWRSRTIQLNMGIGNSQFARDLVNLRVLGLGGAMSVVSGPDLGQQIINAARRIHSACNAPPGPVSSLASGRAPQHRRPGDLSVPGAWAPCMSLPLRGVSPLLLRLATPARHVDHLAPHGRRWRLFQLASSRASVLTGCARRTWSAVEVDKGGWRACAWTERAAKQHPGRRCHAEHGMTAAPSLCTRHCAYTSSSCDRT